MTNNRPRTCYLLLGVTVVVAFGVCLNQLLQDGHVVLRKTPRSSQQSLHSQSASHSEFRWKRVIGGTEISKGEWPWLVNIRGRIPTMFFFWWPVQYTDIYCGGSIINSQWILTAAHCFRVPGVPIQPMSKAKNWFIKAGDVQLTFTLAERLCALWGKIQGTTNAHCWYLKVSDIFIHPNYNAADSWKNDIALVKLTKNLPLGTAQLPGNIAAVTLPGTVDLDWPIPNTNCSFQGWGCTVIGGPLANYANDVTLPALNTTVCANPPDPYNPDDITSTRLCAGYNLMDKGLCKGDSGGPLVCPDGGSWVQAGIASFTTAYDPAEVPGVFTRVSYYMDWINSTMATN